MELTVLQAFKVKPGGHYGRGFRHVPTSAESLNFLNCIQFKDTTSHFQKIIRSSYQTQPCGLKFPIENMQSFWTPISPCTGTVLASSNPNI